MRESELERILTIEIRKLGGRTYKWTSPGNAGVPDRIVFMPGGSIYFVELKTDTGKLSAQQKIQINRLQNLGQTVLAVRGIRGLISFFMIIDEMDTARRLEKRYVEDRKEVRPDEVHTT